MVLLYSVVGIAQVECLISVRLGDSNVIYDALLYDVQQELFVNSFNIFLQKKYTKTQLWDWMQMGEMRRLMAPIKRGRWKFFRRNCMNDSHETKWRDSSWRTRCDLQQNVNRAVQRKCYYSSNISRELGGRTREMERVRGKLSLNLPQPLYYRSRLCTSSLWGVTAKTRYLAEILAQIERFSLKVKIIANGQYSLDWNWPTSSLIPGSLSSLTTAPTIREPPNFGVQV